MPTPSWANTGDSDASGDDAVAALHKTGFADLDEAFRTITATAARILHSERTGIWLFSDHTTAVYCAHEHADSHLNATPSAERNTKSLLQFSTDESYMVRLHNDPVVAFESAGMDDASPRFRSYLKTLGSRSLLDVPLRIDGQVIGMLSHETAPGRAWKDDELNLARRLGDITALAIQTDRHRRTTRDGNRYFALIEQTPDCIAMSAGDGRLEYLNPAARQLFGLAPDEPIEDQQLADFMTQGSDTHMLQSGIAFARHRGTWIGEVALHGRSGNQFEAEVTISSYRGQDGDIDYTSYVIRNIASQAELKRQLRDTQAQYEAVVAETGDAIFRLDGITGQLRHVNDALSHMLGYSVDELEGMTTFDLVADTPDNIRRHMETTIADGRIDLGRRQYRHHDGHYVDLEVAGACHVEDGRPVINIRARDISEQLQRQHDIERLAYYDPVTGLANSNLLRERGEALLALVLLNSSSTVTYIVTQIDHWQRLADTLGYQAAESLLKNVADRFRSIVGDQEIVVARLLSGAEFGLLLESSVQDAQALIRQIDEAFITPVTAEDEQVHLTMRSGVAFFPQDAASFKDLTMRAGLALRDAQRNNTSHSLYKPAQSRRLHDERLLEEELRRAIGSDQIQVYYQPVINAAGAIQGMETLVRWQHPKEGWLPPADFVGLAEECGLITDLDRDILFKSIRTAAPWLHTRQDIIVGINCSALTLTDPRLADTLGDALAQNQLPASQLCIEVTETTLIHNRQAATQALERIKALGAKVALDDFGTGYSSLAYLKNLPVDVLKIDRSFIRGIGVDVRDEHAIETVITLGHDLGLEVLAEGVETDEQREWLLARRIDTLQGFYFSKPQPLAEIRRRYDKVT